MEQTDRPERHSQSELRDPVVLPVVPLGASFRRYMEDLDASWISQARASPASPALPTLGSSQSLPRYKNMLEFAQVTKNVLSLQRSYWQIPGLSSNVLATAHRTKSDVTGSLVKGCREKQFRDWYGKVVHEKHVTRLPSIKPSRSVDHQIGADVLKSQGKITRPQLTTSGIYKSFSHDSVVLPDIHSAVISCRDCGTLLSGNVVGNRPPERKLIGLNKTEEDKWKSPLRDHDAIGKKYCHACTQRRSRKVNPGVGPSVVICRDKRTRS